MYVHSRRLSREIRRFTSARSNEGSVRAMSSVIKMSVSKPSKYGSEQRAS